MNHLTIQGLTLLFLLGSTEMAEHLLAADAPSPHAPGALEKRRERDKSVLVAGPSYGWYSISSGVKHSPNVALVTAGPSGAIWPQIFTTINKNRLGTPRFRCNDSISIFATVGARGLRGRSPFGLTARDPRAFLVTNSRLDGLNIRVELQETPESREGLAIPYVRIPLKIINPGEYTIRLRVKDAKGTLAGQSTRRFFVIKNEAAFQLESLKQMKEQIVDDFSSFRIAPVLATVKGMDGLAFIDFTRGWQAYMPNRGLTTFHLSPSRYLQVPMAPEMWKDGFTGWELVNIRASEASGNRREPIFRRPDSGSGPTNVQDCLPLLKSDWARTKAKYLDPNLRRSTTGKSYSKRDYITENMQVTYLPKTRGALVLFALDRITESRRSERLLFVAYELNTRGELVNKIVIPPNSKNAKWRP